MKYKNILEIINYYSSAENFIGGQFTYFNEHGLNMHLICNQHEDLKDFCQRHKVSYKTMKLTRGISPVADLKALVATCKYIKNHQIDTVIAHQLKGRIVGMIAAYLMRVPNRIMFAHGVSFDNTTGIKRKLLIVFDRFITSLSTKVICVSQSVANIRVNTHIDTQSKQFLLNKGTCNGIDAIDLFNPEKYGDSTIIHLKDKLGINKDDYVLGYCGRLVRDKGIIELVDAFVDLLDSVQYKKLKLLIIGDKDVRDGLPPKTIETIKNHKHIIFTGYVKRTEIAPYYLLMDTFILPSYREGFPTVVLEAMAMGIPVIVSKSTGCIDSILNGINGLYTEIEKTDICENIRKMFNDEYRRKLSSNCRPYVLQNFDNRIIWPYVLQVIEQ